MPIPKNEVVFKESVEKLMKEHGCSFRVMVSPVGRLSTLIYKVFGRFMVLNSSIIIASINVPREPHTNDK